MKNKHKIGLPILCLGLCFPALAAEPDESGIGGTGHSTSVDKPFELFQKPDVPERIELPDTISIPEIPEAAGAGGIAPPNMDTGIGTATGASGPPPR